MSLWDVCNSILLISAVAGLEQILHQIMILKGINTTHNVSVVKTS